MPYINNAGIKIYYEIIGQGEPLILHHWGGGCTQDWYDLGYVDELKKYYQLILIDARGCGKSDKPHEPSLYALELKALDTILIMDDLMLKKAYCLGYSMGGRTVFGLMKYYPNRFKKFIIGGAHPFSSTKLITSLQAMLPKGMSYVVEQSEKIFGPYPEKIRESYLKNDVKALITSYSQPWIDMSNCLSKINIPCLFYTGSKDPLTPKIKQCYELMQGAQLQILENFDHAQAYWQAKIISTLIIDFLK